VNLGNSELLILTKITPFGKINYDKIEGNGVQVRL